MKEHPILFSAPMVRAIFNGSKSQTRRALRVQPPEWVKVWNGSDGAEHFFFDREEDDEGGRHWPDYAKGLPCPYGQPDDQLWVRETWAQNWNQLSDTRMDRSYVYRADGAQRAQDNGTDLPWKPSIHMPRAASRITLEITGVRVERLQDISEADAYAEGIEQTEFCEEAEHAQPATGALPGRYAYRALWESINGPGSWGANPWVWVVEFRVVKPGEVNQQGATR